MIVFLFGNKEKKKKGILNWMVYTRGAGKGGKTNGDE